MDAVSDPLVNTVVWISSAQVGKTELLNNIVGYHVHQDPAPILLLQPTLEMGQAWSKDRLAPMLRDTPALKGRVKDARSRDSGNTLLHKTFPGGHITIAGSNSPASLASRPIRIVLCDEVDRYPPSAGTEGDPVNLARKRTTTFWNRLTLLTSTPTIRGASRIEAEFEISDQRRFFVPCPHCDETQHLKWAQVTWPEGMPEQAQYACEHCGALWTEAEKNSAIKAGEWIATAEFNGRAGFHLNEIYSPWSTLADMAQGFVEAKKSPETLKTWINTSLGETFEEQGEELDAGLLYQRREHYVTDVPAGGLVLTAAVDVQDDRLECGVEAWGVGEENWKVDYRTFWGDPSKTTLWNQVRDFLATRYTRDDGVTLGIACAVVDSGGHYTQQVYQFVKALESRRVYAIKGRGGAGLPVVGRPSRGNIGKVQLFSIGVDTAKEVTAARLRGLEPGPGYVHFPIDERFDTEYFDQLGAEKCVTKFYKGSPRREWVKTRARNEAWDIANYNLAALYILNPNFAVLAAKAGTDEIDDEPEAVTTPTEQIINARRQTKRAGRRRTKGYVNKW